MRTAYLNTLYELASNNKDVLALLADNGIIVYDDFRRDLPEQFINFGIAEDTMVSAAAGLASCGKIPFVYTIAPFLTMRAFEQIRNDVCLQRQNVKLVGTGAGLAYSTLGPTHHATEDLAVMRALPNLTILSPASPLEVGKATRAAADLLGPVYLRLGTSREKEIYHGNYEFKIGKAVTLIDGSDVTIIGTGAILSDICEAARNLQTEGISVRVINMHTIKPIDSIAIEKAAIDTRAIITVEEHNVIGGLGTAVSEVLAESRTRTVLKRLGLKDVFCTSYGPHQSVKEQCGIGQQDIANTVYELLT